jgi:hypothetical protein
MPSRKMTGWRLAGEMMRQRSNYSDGMSPWVSAYFVNSAVV